jgi:hypothetical protein
MPDPDEMNDQKRRVKIAFVEKRKIDRDQTVAKVVVAVITHLRRTDSRTRGIFAALS